MEPSRPFKLIVHGPTPYDIMQNLIEVPLSAAELQAVMIVLGTAPSMMLDHGKGVELREALDTLAQAAQARR